MHGFLAGLRLELRILRADLDSLIPLFTAPLFTIIFLAIVRNGGRHDLQPDALVAPVLMTLWWFALFQGGQLISGDRWQGLLEWLLAAPVAFAAVVLGRITAVMAFGLVGFFEVWGIAELMFGVGFKFHHPFEFVLTRNAITFTNSASFPFYVLGGVFAPIALLPGWIQPVSSVIFMSWSADLLRASLKPAAVDQFWSRVGMVVLLGAVSFAVGRPILAIVLRRIRVTG